MGDLRKTVGFAGSFGRATLRSMLWPEGCIGLLGMLLAFALGRVTSVVDRIAVSSDFLTVTSVLLGVTFTAFTLLATLWTTEYVKLLDSVPGGIVSFLHVFIVNIGLNVLELGILISYRGFAKHLPDVAETSLFLLCSLLFAYLLADAVAIARTLLLHSLERAKQLSKPAPSTAEL
jgi:hypothetical protein